MANTSAVYARIDTELKDQAEEILAKLGITPSSLIQMTYSQVVLNNGLPFEVRIPARVPVAIGSLTKEELDAELEKGMKSIKEGRVYTDEEVDAELKREFGI